MSSNQSDFNTLPIYKLYFDDIEEIFFNTISLNYLLISTLLTFLLILSSVMILFFRSTRIFFACLIPFVYSLIFYDLIQLLSIVLLKCHLLNLSETFFNALCRWPYYLKACSEAGQCLTLIFIFIIRTQKVRYFLKHHRLPTSNQIHSRALAFVCLLSIVYVNNWITHLKVEKIHLITFNESYDEINIEEYPMPLYDIHDVKLNDYSQFYSDLDKYARHHHKTPMRQMKPEKIIYNQKDNKIHEIIIKFPLNKFFGDQKSNVRNRTRRQVYSKFPSPTLTRNNSYRIHRCTYGQGNFFLANFLSLIHSMCYLLFISYCLTTISRYSIPYMIVDYHQTLQDQAFLMGQNKSAERHRQLMLLTRLRHFQYLIIYCHTTLILLRLIYICSLTIVLCFIQSPLRWMTLRILFYSLFCIVYYSIPLRMTCLFLYLLYSLFSPYIHSIFYHTFRTKLHFSCQFQKPTIKFQLHIVQHNPRDAKHDEHATDSSVLNVTSSPCEQQSIIYPNESITVYKENSSGHNVITASSFAIVNISEQSQL